MPDRAGASSTKETKKETKKGPPAKVGLFSFYTGLPFLGVPVPRPAAPGKAVRIK
jgi:hypothetical protein